jgi:hypothetical protein
MAKVLRDDGLILNIMTVDSKEDLKPRPDRFCINPPPRDGRCQRCGRHISQLKRFKGPFLRGALLVKGFRPSGESEVASWECSDCCPLSDGEIHEIIKEIMQFRNSVNN